MTTSRTRARRGEHGAVTTIVSILLAAGVVFGGLAISVDFGNLMFERAQLQNGADASAMSLGRSCATGVANCTPAAANLSSFNNGNGYDGLNGIEQVGGQDACGVNVSTLPACPAPGSGWTDCKPLPPALSGYSTLPYVEVRTKSQSTGGSFVTNFFGRMIGKPQASVGACSRAAWGSPTSGTAIIPLTFSLCEWYTSTNNGTTYPGTDIALKLNAPNIGPSSPCYTWQGHDFPGGFGWLDHDSTCKVQTDQDNWVAVGNGVGDGNDCGPAIQSYIGKVVYLPIFDCASDTKTWPCAGGAHGANSFYHISSYAAFYLTAVQVTGQVNGNLAGHPQAAAAATCTGGDKCVFGWFVKDYVDPGGGGIDPSAPNLGFQRVVAAG